MTKVIFRKFKGQNELIAIFSQLPGTNNYYLDCLSYQSIGQHGACSITYIKNMTVPADRKEYKKLLSELITMGYDDLKVCKYITYADFKARKAAAL